MRPRPSVAVVVFRRPGPEFLLLRRKEARGGGWQPVTGRVEAGEDAPSAARREVVEETGLAPVALWELGLESEFTGYDGARYLERAFAAEVAEGATARPSEEHDGLLWVGADEALRRLRWEENRRAVEKVRRALR